MNIPFALLSFVGFSANLQGLGWTMAAITTMLIIAVYNTYLIIDPDRREIQSKTGFAGSKIIPFDKLQGFTVHKTKYIIIAINVRLIANYINDREKEKETGLAQHFFTRPIQHILNDIDKILEHEYQS